MQFIRFIFSLLQLSLMAPPLHGYPFPRSLANFLFTLKDGPLLPPRLSDLTHFRSFSCTNRQDGAYPDLGAACVSYYRCLGGSVFSYVCPEGLAFDIDQQECVSESRVSCPRLPPATRRCNDQADGFYADYTSECRTYYRCKSGDLVGTGKCERGAIWDYTTASCGAGPRASCSPASCWGLSDGAHPMEGTTCAAYFTCSDGSRTDQVCPAGHSFDYTEKSCIASSRSVCYERACEERNNGLHSMPHAPCQTYFRCFNAALIKVETCSSGQIFDGWSCIASSNFSCWSDSNGSCSGKQDGLYADDDLHCRGFFMCRQNKLVKSFRCSSGMVFDGEKCIDSKNHICLSRPRQPDCSRKHDGFYTMDKSNCRTFYYCQDRTKLSEHNCPGNFVFNGERCVDPLLFTCQYKENFNSTRSIRIHDK